MPSERIKFVLDNPWYFFTKVLAGFRANQGMLLAGAIAYYTLLSIVPIFILILAVLSQVQAPAELLEIIRQYLVLIAPGQADAITNQIQIFIQNWRVVGVLGILILVFFSSFAFTALENAISVIFFHRVAIKRRHFLISAIIPYCYIVLIALGMLIVSIVSGSMHSVENQSLNIFGQTWSLSQADTILIYVLGISGEILLLTSLYLVMPVGQLSLRHAVIGGVTATVLWELTRHILVWYFTTLSFVNVIYGTFATVIIILISLEAAAIILLLGAQVIAEYERIDQASGTLHGLQT